MNALKKKIKEKKVRKRHVTAVRMAPETWNAVVKLGKKINLTANTIMNVAIDELLKRERA